MERWLSWSKAHDWKSCNGLNPFEGSNPSLSATSERVTLVPIFYFIKISHPLHRSFSFAKSHARLTCSAQNVLTTTRCRFLLRCAALVAADKPPYQSPTAAPTNPRCIPHRGRSDVLPTFCELESSTATAQCPTYLFHVAFTCQKLHFSLVGRTKCSFFLITSRE